MSEKSFLDDSVVKSKPQCQFFVIKKKRLCRMTVRQGQQFCGEHIDFPLNSNKVKDEAGDDVQDTRQDSDRQRVPCPYDSKHTCFKHQLLKHTARCNSKPGDCPAYIVPGLNRGDSESIEKISLNDLSDDSLMNLIARVHHAHNGLIIEDEGSVEDHPVLTSELQRPDLGVNAGKHLRQNSAFLSLLQRNNLFQPHSCFLELGAGKGKLTYWIAQATKEVENCFFALVDRASYRHKNENKLKSPENENEQILRIRADIADLCLRRVVPLERCQKLVAVSKHLCGAATDLALRCLINSVDKELPNGWDLNGIAMATCCHHRCSWSEYVGKKYFEDIGLGSREFAVMTTLASWATCGSGRSRDPQTSPSKTKGTSPALPDLSAKAENKHKDRYDRLNLPQKTREDIGKKCKYLIDIGRNKFLQSAGLKSKLLFYVSPKVTLENVCILAVSNN